MLELKKYNFLVGVFFLALVPVIITQDPYYLYVLIRILIWGTASASLWLTIRTGIFNLGHAAFMAIGAYTTALLQVKAGLSFWLSLPIAGVAAIVVAILIGIPILRIKGMYFVLVTFAFTEVVTLLIANFPKYTGGYDGIRNIPAPKILATDFSAHVPYYYLVLFFMSIFVFICYRIWNSRIGKIFSAIAASETLCESVGVPVTKYKILSFVTASFFGALCGSFITPLSGVIDPLMFGMSASVNCFLYMVLGGVGSIFGPIIGTTLAILISEGFRFMLELAPAIIGLIIIILMLFLPEGLIGIPQKILQLVKRVRKAKIESRERLKSKRVKLTRG
jgi:branched-chain amino acid transport system permease protein